MSKIFGLKKSLGIHQSQKHFVSKKSLGVGLKNIRSRKTSLGIVLENIWSQKSLGLGLNEIVWSRHSLQLVPPSLVEHVFAYTIWRNWRVLILPLSLYGKSATLTLGKSHP